MRCPTATGGGILARARSLPMRRIASRWSGIPAVSETKVLPLPSCTTNLALVSPIAEVSPESRVSVRSAPARYNPNLSEDEPLFSARMTCSGRSCAMGSRLRSPAPVADFRHVIAVFADIELVAFHHRPITRRRLLHLAAEPGNPPDGVQCELVAVEIVQHDHVERSGGGSLLLVAAHMDIVVVVPVVGQLVDDRRIAVIGENHRLVGGEQLVEILIFQTVRVFRLRLQHHQVDDVDDPERMSGTYSRSK